MFIVGVPIWDQAPLGAACLSRGIAASHMPLLKELENSTGGWRFYKHAAPDGAFAKRLVTRPFWRVNNPRYERLITKIARSALRLGCSKTSTPASVSRAMRRCTWICFSRQKSSKSAMVKKRMLGVLYHS